MIVSARRCRTNLLHAGFTLALAATAAHAQEEQHHHATVGTLHFPVNANAAATREFDRGVALLHNFEYVDAVAAFRRAERVDPTLALAWYGEALTFRHPLWGEEQLDSARSALARLAPNKMARLAKLASERERSYGAAAEALFADEPEAARTRAFADSMRAVVARYSSDDEAKAFASIAMLGAAVFIRPVARARPRALEHGRPRGRRTGVLRSRVELVGGRSGFACLAGSPLTHGVCEAAEMIGARQPKRTGRRRASARSPETA